MSGHEEGPRGHAVPQIVKNINQRVREENVEAETTKMAVKDLDKFEEQKKRIISELISLKTWVNNSNLMPLMMTQDIFIKLGKVKLITATGM